MKKNTVIIIVVLIALAIIIYYYSKRKNMLLKPVSGRITSKFGNRINPISGAAQFHNGVDFAVPTGTPINAPADGKILKIYQNDQGGNQLIMMHAKGYLTGYAHLSSYNKKVGDTVKQGEVIAFSGNTGASTGAHLHFTLTDPKGNKLDPEQWFNKELV